MVKQIKMANNSVETDSNNRTTLLLLLLYYYYYLYRLFININICD